MFKTTEVGNSVSKEEYEAQVPNLRADLINVQHDLKSQNWPLLILLIGDDWSGCEDVVELLNEWMDARFVETHAFEEPTDEELERPRFWRYWRALPADGRGAIFMGAWASRAIVDRATGELDKSGFADRLAHIRAFEKALVDDGGLLLKIWLHTPKKEFKKRLDKAEKRINKWSIAARDRRVFDHYDELLAIGETYIRDTGGWAIIESTDSRYRDLTVGAMVRDAITARMETTPIPPHVDLPPISGVAPLDDVDLTTSIEKKEYKERLQDYQDRLAKLNGKAHDKAVTTVLAFEGWDAGGKGGAIRRITRAIPASTYRVVQVAAPTEEEKARHYLWRFWRHLPRAGRMVIFDRTWYGRVLVERVEGYAPDADWMRAYDEINDFEDQLVEHGIAFAKFWLQIDADEQMRRFQAREQTGYKMYKITEEDYRNRDKWEDYVAAVNEMVTRTGTERAPWTLVPANDKRTARLKVLETVCDRLEELL